MFDHYNNILLVINIIVQREIIRVLYNSKSATVKIDNNNNNDNDNNNNNNNDNNNNNL